MKLLCTLVASAALTCFILTGCKQEPPTPAERMRAFTDTFGFAPGTEVTNIQYHSSSGWAPNLGGYQVLIRFNYVPAAVEKIKQGFALSYTHASVGSVTGAPEWWTDQPLKEKIYYGATNGIARGLWVDESQGWVFYKEANYD